MRFVPLSLFAIALLGLAAPASAQMDGPFNGFYAGLNAGYGFGKNTIRNTGIAAANNATLADGARPPYAKMDSEGFLGGIQAGHNWQMDHYVFGLETDAQYSTIYDRRNFVTVGTAFPGTRNNTFHRDMSWLGTTRARLGYAWDNTLAYVTGGVAYGRLREDIMLYAPQPTNTLQFASTHDRTNFGWTLGAGFEQALDDHWSIRTEYLFFDLNRTQLYSNPLPGSGGTGTGYVSWFDNRGQIARVGINYRID